MNMRLYKSINFFTFESSKINFTVKVYWYQSLKFATKGSRYLNCYTKEVIFNGAISCYN